MNTQTGNIFDIDGNPLAENEVELTKEEFAKLFPIRDLNERLARYQQMQRPTGLTERTEPSQIDQPTGDSQCQK